MHAYLYNHRLVKHSEQEIKKNFNNNAMTSSHSFSIFFFPLAPQQLNDSINPLTAQIFYPHQFHQFQQYYIFCHHLNQLEKKTCRIPQLPCKHNRKLQKATQLYYRHMSEQHDWSLSMPHHFSHILVYDGERESHIVNNDQPASKTPHFCPEKICFSF